MGARQFVYAIDEGSFVNLLASTMADVLASVLSESPDFAERHPWSVLAWSSEIDGDVSYYICADSRIKLIQNARVSYWKKDDLPQAPGMSFTVRNFIAGQSSYQLQQILQILAEASSCSFVQSLVDGERRWWIHSLLQAASFWFGSNCPDYVALHALCQKLLRVYGTADVDLGSLAFPVLPREDCDNWMGVWTPEETENAIFYSAALLDSGVTFARYHNITYPETEARWDAWVRRIISQLLVLHRDGFASPIVVSFNTS